MLVNIKSSYFIKNIFSDICQKTKFKLIKYNKYFQNIIDINLVNYKIFSGRYINYEEKGKGKEYNYYNELIYEGEYLNGERNGKGKEYFTHKLIFEGIKFLMNENRKVYNYDGISIYDGYYKDGRRNGKGKEYNIDGILIFEGEYLNGKRWNGKGYDHKKKCNI